MGRRIRYSRPKTAPPETLLDFLCIRFSYLSRGEWERHLAAGHLRVCSPIDSSTVATSGDYVLRQNDEINFDPPRELEPSVDEYIYVVHDDDAVLVCVKNGNLPVAEGGRYSGNTLVGLLQRRSAESVVFEDDASAGKKRDRAEVENGDAGIAANKMPASYHPVHRLDKETSGLVVLAKQAAAARGLSTQFEQQSERLAAEVARWSEPPGYKLSAEEFETFVSDGKYVNKSYIAVLAGAAPEGAAFVMCDRIGLLFDSLPKEGTTEGVKQHTKLKKLKMTCYPANLRENPRQLGRPAISRIRILGSDKKLGVSVARVDILTGRTHQIRLHCAQLGYPVLGDKLYETTTPGVVGGGCAVADDTYLARARGSESLVSAAAPRLRVRRHLLHAAALSFLHPVTGERMAYFADPREWLLRDIVEETEGAAVETMADGSCSALEALQQLLGRAMGALAL
ncbi:putative RNA pseudouridylate synthase [Trypanosoma conorhini]|uniref:Putative RNA pseudouridylate synthase n=1 Tax=Trypanosoma conorhini TaxID=83891 RepID=A0A3R7KN85_9TRYP|nr:putative RNA pseudouridylate synthase [Trypanosoma conorhini]RNF05097.1 putative RNA pseudouridylate synthase [Trypanosoma conorhini]